MNFRLDKMNKIINYNFGFIGGMGTFAAISFLEYFYNSQKNRISNEQNFLNAVLLNVADMPERDFALRNQKISTLYEKLNSSIDQLLFLDVKNISILCYTMHILLENLSTDRRECIISLVDLTLRRIIQSEKKCLLLATTIAHEHRVFQRSSYWENASNFIVNINDNHQTSLQRYIQNLKVGKSKSETIKFLTELMTYYGVSYCATGCTEFFTLLGHEHTLNLLHPIDLLLEDLLNTNELEEAAECVAS